MIQSQLRASIQLWDSRVGLLFKVTLQQEKKQLLDLTVHADRQVYGKAAAVKALKVITASQQHVFPLCARLELKFLLPVRCGSLLSQSGLFSFFFFFSGLLNCHPLKSRESAPSSTPHS